MHGNVHGRWSQIPKRLIINGLAFRARFHHGTPLKTIRARRDELRASLRTLSQGGRHTLNHDAGRYLDQVRSTLIAFHDRERELRAWLPPFGHLRTLALPAQLLALNAQLHEWHRTFAASTCNHRRHALTNLAPVLYGRRASFDPLDLVRFAPPPPKPRWIDRRHIAAVLAEIPAGSVTRVRLELMHWTGMRPSQLGPPPGRGLPARRADPLRRRPARQERPARRRPLVPEGVAAARAFRDAEAFGPWPRSSVNRALASAARRAGRPAFTTYQIRHSFAAGLRRAGTDVADIQDIYGHTGCHARAVWCGRMAEPRTTHKAMTRRSSPARTPCPRTWGGSQTKERSVGKSKNDRA